jgi:hypothetical protein
LKTIALKTLLPALAGAALLVACGDNGPAAPQLPTPAVYTALGDSATIAAKLDEFRVALGGNLNAPNSPPADSGRREINWDGVGAAVTNIDTFPANFFNVTSKRGAVFGSPIGTGLRVDSTNFAAVNAGLGAQFNFFSPKKTFMSVGTINTQVDFQVVGTTTPGVVNGFGVIFSDVDRPGATRVTFYDQDGVILADLVAPGRSGAQEYSFVGAVFTSAIVAFVRIVSGEASLVSTSVDVSAGGTTDLVVMDDFVYGEPHPIP